MKSNNVHKTVMNAFEKYEYSNGIHFSTIFFQYF
jgi:hypothetical protein